MKALCGSVQPGGDRLRDCMREHRAQLSNACKVAIADRMLERGTSKAARAAQRPNISALETGHIECPLYLSYADMCIAKRHVR